MHRLVHREQERQIQFDFVLMESHLDALLAHAQLDVIGEVFVKGLRDTFPVGPLGPQPHEQHPDVKRQQRVLGHKMAVQAQGCMHTKVINTIP